MSANQCFLDLNDSPTKPPGVPQGILSRKQRFHVNLRAFFSRVLNFVQNPRRFASLAVDLWLLVQSAWIGKQPGPDLVYPMLSIRKRQSGRLARLILEHCRGQLSCELHSESNFPKGIDPPCVAVIDLDQVPHHVVQNKYSTQVDLYGLMCILIFFDTTAALIVHVFHLRDQGWLTVLGFWVACAVRNLTFCIYGVSQGDGTLTLARRSDPSTPGCAVFLDQDFTVVLNGDQSLVEAVSESSFNLSHPNPVWRIPLVGESEDKESVYNIFEAVWDAVCLVVFALCCLLFRPSTTQGFIGPTVIVAIIAFRLQKAPPYLGTFQIWSTVDVFLIRFFPPLYILSRYKQVTKKDSPLAPDWQDTYIFTFLLSALFIARYRPRNYPIRSRKVLDALGHPLVRKWQFDTLAAAVTFQCLVLCHRIDRPVRSVDVLAFLDMLVPDQRDVWKTWKERVADRIMHEVDISFAPTIPTFRDGRQQQLKELLDQAQMGYDAYRRF
ncbi:hypothetical protein EV363DRAFT_1217042 [Boletus edulis]|nr:hypothetical protein EV363DRAFT_1217042 [Boletus edulis]